MIDELKRAAYMLGIASKYIEENNPEDIIRYDEADCDGYCVVDDCRSSAEEVLDIIRRMEDEDG